MKKKHGSELTAADLYNSIPIVHPTVTELVLPIKPDKGIYKFRTKADFQELPSWNWEQIFNFVR